MSAHAMDERLQGLLDLAFDRAPAREANLQIARVREALGGPATVHSYECVVPPGAGPDWFTSAVLPRLVYHLESLGLRPPAATGVFLSVFSGDELLFVHAKDALAWAGRLLDLSADEMTQRFGTGEKRTAQRPDEPRTPAPPRLIGPGK